MSDTTATDGRVIGERALQTRRRILEATAALLRDQIGELKAGTGLSKIEPKKKPVTYGKPKRGAGSTARAGK